MSERMSELTNGKWVSDEKGSAFFGKKALEILRQCLAHNNRLKDRIAELEKKIEYLCLDQENYEPILVAENQRLKAELKKYRNYIPQKTLVPSEKNDE